MKHAEIWLFQVEDQKILTANRSFIDFISSLNVSEIILVVMEFPGNNVFSNISSTFFVSFSFLFS